MVKTDLMNLCKPTEVPSLFFPIAIFHHVYQGFSMITDTLGTVASA